MRARHADTTLPDLNQHSQISAAADVGGIEHNIPCWFCILPLEDVSATASI
jgi:hypothetical protein